jgi:hypothetical protein
VKKIIFLCWFLFVGSVAAQVTVNMVGGIKADSLKSTRKIVTVRTDYPYNSNMTVALKTVSGVDTVYCTTISRDSTYNTSKVLIDLSTGSPVSYMVATTTAKEYLVYDPLVLKVTLTTINGLVTTKFTVSRK